jgi:hypothetical protein
MIRRNWYVWLMMATLAVFSGCETQVQPTSVGGTVTFDGKPVEGATVSFSPTGEGGKIAVGKTDVSGNFTLNTPSIGEGAVPGSYKVSISKTTAVANGAGGFEDPRGMGGEMTEEQKEQMMSMADTMKMAYKSELPAKYGSPNNSGFTAEVTEGGDNNFTFDMTK